MPGNKTRVDYVLMRGGVVSFSNVTESAAAVVVRRRWGEPAIAPFAAVALAADLSRRAVEDGFPNEVFAGGFGGGELGR